MNNLFEEITTFFYYVIQIQKNLIDFIEEIPHTLVRATILRCLILIAAGGDRQREELESTKNFMKRVYFGLSFVNFLFF